MTSFLGFNFAALCLMVLEIMGFHAKACVLADTSFVSVSRLHMAKQLMALTRWTSATGPLFSRVCSIAEQCVILILTRCLFAGTFPTPLTNIGRHDGQFPRLMKRRGAALFMRIVGSPRRHVLFQLEGGVYIFLFFSSVWGRRPK